MLIRTISWICVMKLKDEFICVEFRRRLEIGYSYYAASL